MVTRKFSRIFIIIGVLSKESLISLFIRYHPISALVLLNASGIRFNQRVLLYPRGRQLVEFSLQMFCLTGTDKPNPRSHLNHLITPMTRLFFIFVIALAHLAFSAGFRVQNRRSSLISPRVYMSNGITEFFSPEMLVGPLITSTVVAVSLAISTKSFDVKFDKLESNMVNQEKIFNLKFENLEKSLETLGKKVENLVNATATNTNSYNELKSRLDSSSYTIAALVSVGAIFSVIYMIYGTIPK